MAKQPKLTYQVVREEYVECENCKAWALPDEGEIVGTCYRHPQTIVKKREDGCFEGIPDEEK